MSIAARWFWFSASSAEQAGPSSSRNDSVCRARGIAADLLHSRGRDLELSERGGVLGAMELGYQRGKIQEESLHYEHLKHTGEYPIIGVNTFRNPNGDHVPDHVELQRSTEEEKQSQSKRLEDLQKRHASDSRMPASG